MQLKPPRGGGSVLGALASGALALPGLAGSAAATGRLEEAAADYSFSFYSEDGIADSKLAPGSTSERYEIQIHQFHAAAPLAQRMDLAFDLAYETMSGASPWFVRPDATGRPVQVMSGATIEDARTDASLKGGYYFDDSRVYASTGVSMEKDYLSFNGGLEGHLDLFDEMTTVSAGVGASFDQVKPSDSEIFILRPEEEQKNSTSLFAGVSQILDRNSTAQSTLTYRYASGYLSDPYKEVYVAGNLQADTRPGARHQVTWLSRFRHHVPRIGGTLHADYRFYADSWSMTSHTAALAWYQTLWETLQIVPTLRYYSQSQADFYAVFFNAPRSDGYYSSDYRLSPYGALSWGVEAEWRLREWKRSSWLATLSWQQYVSDGGLALGHVSVENPGLVSFHLFSVGLKASF